MQDVQTRTDPSEDALQAAMPALRKTTVTGWLLVAVIAAVMLTSISFVASAGEDALELLVAVAFFGIFAVIGVGSWVRKRHESEIMPILSTAFGLTYVKTPVRYFDMLPASFLPRGGRQTCDDLMSGTIGGRRYQFIEVKTETGGKNSRTLFDGVVVEVATRTPLPAFIIAPVAETQGFLFFKGNVGVQDKVQVDSFHGLNGQDYGLWMETGDTADGTRLRPFMEKMLNLGASLTDGSLYSVASTVSTIFVAIRHKAELFRIGGLLATEADIMHDIRDASGQFAMPLRLATEVMRAEDALMAAMEKTA